jgi:chromosome segregation ATPase
MLEKLSLATKILLVGSILWVGSVIFKRDNALKEALSKIESAQLDIRSAQVDIKVARDSMMSVQKQLTNLTLLATETQNTLRILKDERSTMSDKFNQLITNNEKLLDSQRKMITEIKKNQDAMLAKIDGMQMERSVK